MRTPFHELLSFFAIPFALHFSKPKAPAVTYTPPPPPAPPAPPPPPSPKAATQNVRDQLSQMVPKTGRRSTLLTNGLADMADGRRTLLGSPYRKPKP